MLQQMFEVTATRNSFPRNNADVCVTDQQRRRRYSIASNMVQDLVKATHYATTKAV